jgi:hypothetical protein
MTMTQNEIFDKLFKESKCNVTQGIKLQDEKVYISGEVISTGLLKSAEYDGRINETSGVIEQAPKKGLCINLNTGTFSTPHFAI